MRILVLMSAAGWRPLSSRQKGDPPPPGARKSRQRLRSRCERGHAEAVASADTAANAGSAAAHLRTSWTCLHALHPDPVKAYSEAIKAVEAAAHALAEPNNRKATLGSMIGALRNSQHRYSLIIGTNRERDIATLIGMMVLLWDGQTSRHGAST
jgi:hypothetical protein